MNLHRAMQRQTATAITRRHLVRPSRATPNTVNVLVAGETYAKGSPWRHFGPEFAEWTKVMIEAHGVPPYHRDAAVAHEAGHAVTSMSMGAGIKSLSVTQHPSMPAIWGGWCEYEWPPTVRHERVHAILKPLESTHAMVNALAGVAGEIAAGHGHKASSLDETYEVFGLCRGVADKLNLDSDEIFQRLLQGAIQRIAQNQDLFEGIRTSMSDRDELQAADIEALIAEHGVTQVPVVAAW